LFAQLFGEKFLHDTDAAAGVDPAVVTSHIELIRGSRLGEDAAGQSLTFADDAVLDADAQVGGRSSHPWP
jgi:hypothetical protein